MCEPPQKGERSFAGGRSAFADTGLCNLGSRLQHSRVALENPCRQPQSPKELLYLEGHGFTRAEKLATDEGFRTCVSTGRKNRRSPFDFAQGRSLHYASLPVGMTILLRGSSISR